MDNKKAARFIRWGLLASLLIWVTYESFMHQVLGGGKSPSIHALCPYGALESLYALMFSGTYIQKIYSGTFIIFGITLLIAILFRRSFCGLLCPFGALQELFARVGKRIFKKHLTVPVKADRYLRYLKYVIMFLTLFMAWRLGRLWMSSYDPYAAYGHLTAISGTLAEDPLSIVGFILLGVTLVGSFVYDRFFCKYLCPAGAFYAIVSKVSPTKIQRNNDSCIHCNLCTKTCPVNLNVAEMDSVKSAECLNCNECVNVCPEKGALEIKTFKKTVSPLVMVALVAGLFFIPIFVSQAAGIFEVLPESQKVDGKISITEIKGYMSIDDAAKSVGLPEEQFRTVMKIPSSVPSGTLMKDISAIVEGYDFDIAKEDAAEILTPGSSPESTPSGESDAAEKIDVSLVKGSMTITDAAEAVGQSQKEFYTLFKIPDNVSPSTKMKDIGNVVAGYDFNAIKAELE
ncbi:MAG: 4Fe-4S binding protein [Clostridiaceae bacterium]